MSYPYPQDRHLDRKEKGEQPYADAKEAMGQQEASLQAQAEEYGEVQQFETDEDRAARVAAEMEKRLRRVGDASQPPGRTNENDDGKHPTG